MKKRSVPLHLQDHGSDDCGPISALMVLDYFGITDNREEVMKAVPRSYFGTTTFDVALVLENFGLHTEIITAQPLLFDGDFIRQQPGRKAIKQRVAERKKQEKKQERKEILDSLERYLDNYSLKLAIPSQEHITSALDNGKLVMAATYAEAIGKNQGKYHFVVISDHKTGQFFINNPWPLSRKTSWEDAGEVLFAVHASTLFDYDNGALLVVGK